MAGSDIPGDAESINNKIIADGFSGSDVYHDLMYQYPNTTIIRTYTSNYLYSGTTNAYKQIKIVVSERVSIYSPMQIRIYDMNNILLFEQNAAFFGGTPAKTYYFNTVKSQFKISVTNSETLWFNVYIRKAQYPLAKNMKIKKWNSDYTAFMESTLDNPIILTKTDYDTNRIGGAF